MTRSPVDPTRKFSEGGSREHQLALTIACGTCKAPAGEWCPMPGTSWNLCARRIADARGYDDEGRSYLLPRNASKEVIAYKIERIQDQIDHENHWWNNHRHLWTKHGRKIHDEIVDGLRAQISDLKRRP